MNRPQVFILSMAACMYLVSLPLHAAPAIIAPCVACHGDDGMGHGNPMIPVISARWFITIRAIEQ
jgi:cytochrome c553